MSTDHNNDAEPHNARPTPDSCGQAALLLVESLIHGLISRSIITTDDAINIVDTACSVQSEAAEEADGAGVAMWRSHAMLTAIGDSLKIDEDGRSTRLPTVAKEVETDTGMP